MLKVYNQTWSDNSITMICEHDVHHVKAKTETVAVSLSFNADPGYVSRGFSKEGLE